MAFSAVTQGYRSPSSQYPPQFTCCIPTSSLLILAKHAIVSGVGPADQTVRISPALMLNRTTYETGIDVSEGKPQPLMSSSKETLDPTYRVRALHMYPYIEVSEIAGL